MQRREDSDSMSVFGMMVSRICLIILWLACLQPFTDAQDGCPRPVEEDFGGVGSPSSDGIVPDSYTGNPQVQILELNTVCLASAGTRERYQNASVVVRYTCVGGECDSDVLITSQFDVQCSQGEWENVFRNSPPDADMETELDDSCWLCLHPQPAADQLVTTDAQTHCAGEYRMHVSVS